ncbi:MAG: cupredoxin domain-containing protein [bacterium]
MKIRKIFYRYCTAILLIGVVFWSCKDQFIVSSPTLTVTLTATPVFGEAPLSGVDLTAQISGGGKGAVTYRFDCTSDGIFDVETTTDDETFTAVDVCSYENPGTYTARVVVERGDMSSNATITLNVAAPSPSQTAEDSIVVSMEDNFFSPKEVTVKPGTKIIWLNVGQRPHTSTSDDDLWDSGTINKGETYSWIVPEETQSGASYPYYCVFHGAKGGIGMAGLINIDDGTGTPLSDTVNVSMKDNFFSPKDVTVEPGTTILWKNFGLIAHTSTSDDNIWDSGTVGQGESYAWKVPADTQMGVDFPYYCIFHGDPGGVGMAGTIHVSPGGPTLSVALTAEPAAGEAPLQGVDLTAQVSGTATGSITYRFDCTGDGAFEHEFTGSSDIYTAVDVCGYDSAGSYTAKVVAEREGLTAEATTTLTVDEPPPPPTGGEMTVSMKDNFFSPREVTVKPGTKIVWPNVGARPHTSTSDDGVWDSGTINTGQSFSWTVPQTAQSGNDFPYYCVFHGAQGGIGMAGLIHVDEAPPTGPTLSVALTAEPAAGEAPLQGVDLTAQVSGTATGSITYRFDCTGDGAFEHEFTGSSDIYTAVDVCGYDSAGSYTAKVVAERQGLTAEATATITVDEPPPPPTGNEVTVQMKDNFFSPRDVVVQPGVKITWEAVGRKDHTSTSDTGIWDSGRLAPGGSYSWTVPANTQEGTNFPYYCVFHGDRGGKGMAGTIHVSNDSTPPPVVSDTVIVTVSGSSFSPEKVEIEPGTTVLWKFSGATHNVTFEDDEETPPGGNIPDSPPGSEVARIFPAEGDYDYECTLHKGQEGRIRVRNEN